MASGKSDENIDPIAEAIRALVPDYLKKRKKDAGTILKALSNNDYEAISIMGHNMKGTGTGYGFERITEIGKSIEMAANNKNHDIIKKAAADLSAYLDSIQIT